MCLVLATGVLGYAGNTTLHIDAQIIDWIAEKRMYIPGQKWNTHDVRQDLAPTTEQTPP